MKHLEMNGGCLTVGDLTTIKKEGGMNLVPIDELNYIMMRVDNVLNKDGMRLTYQFKDQKIDVYYSAEEMFNILRDMVMKKIKSFPLFSHIEGKMCLECGSMLVNVKPFSEKRVCPKCFGKSVEAEKTCVECKSHAPATDRCTQPLSSHRDLKGDHRACDFWEERPDVYPGDSDPNEIQNCCGTCNHWDTLKKMRKKKGITEVLKCKCDKGHGYQPAVAGGGCKDWEFDPSRCCRNCDSYVEKEPIFNGCVCEEVYLSGDENPDKYYCVSWENETVKETGEEIEIICGTCNFWAEIAGRRKHSKLGKPGRCSKRYTGKNHRDGETYYKECVCIEVEGEEVWERRK